MPSNIKQARAINFLSAEYASGSYTARASAISAQLDTVTGTFSSNGTSVAGGSYADQLCPFGTAVNATGGTYSAVTSSTGTPTWICPIATITGVTLKDTNGGLVAGPLASPKTTGAGDTVAAAVGAFSIAI